MDGRVLNVLTVDDLLVNLRITNLLHHHSIKRGIQVLRAHRFDYLTNVIPILILQRNKDKQQECWLIGQSSVCYPEVLASNLGSIALSKKRGDCVTETIIMTKK